MNRKMKYRPEIDGLRSFAILPVIFYHAGLSWMPGGFIGVDVFFVISGYLITRIILSDFDAGVFSIARFYERRMRRILPALLVVVFSTTTAMLFLALPSQVEQISASAIFTIFSVSNFYFWMQSGYFSPETEFMPLLHTWSLAVEEQFYLLFPLFLVLLKRFGAKVGMVLAVLLPFAFATSLWLSFNKPAVAFYLLPARAWELGLGAVLAAGIVPKVDSRLVKELLSMLGIGALCFGVLSITSYDPFPGYVALLPCLGAAAVIHCSDAKTGVGRILSSNVLVFVGLISYSLYLWHWPVFVFTRMYLATVHLPGWAAICGILLVFLIATVSWKFVESPCRRMSQISFGWLGSSIAVICLIIVTVSISSIFNVGWPNRLSSETKLISEASSDFDPLRKKCSGFRVGGRAGECSFGPDEKPVSYVLVGDSHAGALRPAFDSISAFANRRGSLWNLGGCPFLIGTRRVPDPKLVNNADCEQFQMDVFQALEASPEITTVIVVNRWAPIFTGIASEIGGSYRVDLLDAHSKTVSPTETTEAFERSLQRTVDALTSIGKEVILIGGVPEAGFDVPTILALSLFNGSGQMKVYSPDFHETTNLLLDSKFAEIAKNRPGVFSISVREAFCESECRISHDGVPLFYDDDHMTASAAKSVVSPVLDKMLSSQSVK